MGDCRTGDWQAEWEGEDGSNRRQAGRPPLGGQRTHSHKQRDRRSKAYISVTNNIYVYR